MEVPVLAALCAGGGTQRFNAVRREVSSISQKSLVTCLRRLKASGLVDCIVLTTGELAVEYRVTSLGHILEAPVAALLGWSGERTAAVRNAPQAYVDRVATEN
ncbi:winged helix-turn-helix transcriptional regulator [Sphingobium ummariense]